MRRLAFGLTIAGLVMEGVMAIPVLGATVIVGLYWIPLAIAFAIHVSLLVLRNVISGDGRNFIAAPIMGIIASVLGIIPFVGWALHLAAAIVYIVDLGSGNSKKIGEIYL